LILYFYIIIYFSILFKFICNCINLNLCSCYGKTFTVATGFKCNACITNYLGGKGGNGYGGLNGVVNTNVDGFGGTGPQLPSTYLSLITSIAGVNGTSNTTTKTIASIIDKYGATKIRSIVAGCGGGGVGTATADFGGYSVSAGSRKGSGIAFTDIYYFGTRLIGNIRISSNSFSDPAGAGANSTTEANIGGINAIIAPITYPNVDLTDASITLTTNSTLTHTAFAELIALTGPYSGKGGNGGSWVNSDNGFGDPGATGTTTSYGKGGNPGLWINSIQYILNNTSYNKGIIKDKNNP
jgi:hypothetical protein